MAQRRNYLLGRGERLAKEHDRTGSGRQKNPPYDFVTSRNRLVRPVELLSKWADRQPDSACPNNRVVAAVTIHPRYISKSEQPTDFFERIGLSPIGRRELRSVVPDAWGVKEHPEGAPSDQIYVAASRDSLRKLAVTLPSWQADQPGADELARIERIEPFEPNSKLHHIPEEGRFAAEVVLHNAGDPKLVDSFARYAKQIGIEVVTDRRLTVGWLSFIPARMETRLAGNLAEFTFVRAVREMPRMRTVDQCLAELFSFNVDLPQQNALSTERRAVIFDGGIPQRARQQLRRWVRLVEPPGIGRAADHLERHGLAVTSAFLFGPLDEKVTRIPPCPVDHVRVMDDQSGKGDDFEYFSVLERILNHLDEAPRPYAYGCLSLGPERAINDDDVTAWTAELDARLSQGHMLLSVAAGNEGDRSDDDGLNRIQPPSDGVNILSVGAADSRGAKWKRAPYSSVGPGRCPGVFKPDGLAFGGVKGEAFGVLGADGQREFRTGTSFAAPFALHVSAATGALLGKTVHPLSLRALMVHNAQRRSRQRQREVGWGRFLEDPIELTTCGDCEAVILYQGNLPLSKYLRAELPLPKAGLRGKVDITATLAIASEVDPEHASTYTRAGLEVRFRPHAKRFGVRDDGGQTAEPVTEDFFSGHRLTSKLPEFKLRKDAHKWEPILRASRSLAAEDLHKPILDIYYHHRAQGKRHPEPKALRYALVVTVRSEETPDLYVRVLRAYSEVLVPLKPRVSTQVQL
jgi:hypothetical protein